MGVPRLPSLAEAFPELAAQLVDPDDASLSGGSGRIVLWRCPNHPEPYRQRVGHRRRGIGCAYCAGHQALVGFNDMATTHPHLAAELVGTDPTTVVAGTTRKLLWRCPNHEQPYMADGHNRVAGKGCGYCAGHQVLVGFNDMATTHPHLAAELVGTDPTTVVAGTTRKLLWRCPNHEQPFEAPGVSRAAAGTGCGYCANLRVLVGFNDMATTHPHLAAELVGTDPTTVTARGRRKCEWACARCSHQWWASPGSRADGGGCPACTKRKGFDVAKPAHIYFMSRHGEQQIGVTSRLTKRYASHRAKGWKLIESLGPIPGWLALEIESQVKRWLRDHVGLIAGTHENWSTANLEVRQLDEIFDRASVDPRLRAQLALVVAGPV
jgi:hypothetical protein